MAGVESCCFGVCSLRTGSLIILWFTAVVDALIYICTHSCLRFMHFSRELSIGDVFGGGPLVSFQLASAVFALYGIKKRKPSYLLPFIGVSVFQVVFEAIPFGFLLSSLLDTDPYSMSSLEKILFRTFLSVLAIVSYFTVIVYSYYKQMVNEIARISNAAADVVVPSTPVSHGTMVSGGGYTLQPQPVHQPYYGGHQYDTVQMLGNNDKL